MAFLFVTLSWTEWRASDIPRWKKRNWWNSIQFNLHFKRISIRFERIRICINMYFSDLFLYKKKKTFFPTRHFIKPAVDFILTQNSTGYAGIKRRADESFSTSITNAMPFKQFAYYWFWHRSLAKHLYYLACLPIGILYFPRSVSSLLDSAVSSTVAFKQAATYAHKYSTHIQHFDSKIWLSDRGKVYTGYRENW